MSRLRRGHRLRRRRQQIVDALRDDRDRARSAWATACTRPISFARPRCAEPRPGQEQLPRRRPADLRQHVRRNDRRQDAELHLGEGEHASSAATTMSLSGFTAFGDSASFRRAARTANDEFVEIHNSGAGPDRPERLLACLPVGDGDERCRPFAVWPNDAR